MTNQRELSRLVLTRTVPELKPRNAPNLPQQQPLLAMTPAPDPDADRRLLRETGRAVIVTWGAPGAPTPTRQSDRFLLRGRKAPQEPAEAGDRLGMAKSAQRHPNARLIRADDGLADP